MNPYLETIRALNLSANSQGEWSLLYLLLRALGDPFTDGANNVHTNAPKEALRRIGLIDSGGHGFARLSFLLNTVIVANDR